jgi:hypothetical protein
LFFNNVPLIMEFTLTHFARPCLAEMTPRRSAPLTTMAPSIPWRGILIWGGFHVQADDR